MVNSSLDGLKGMCAEVVDNVINVHKKISVRTPTFTVFCLKCGVLVGEVKK